MNRKEKIDKIVDIFDESKILMIDSTKIGMVDVDESRIIKECIEDYLSGEIADDEQVYKFTEQEVKAIVSFLYMSGILLVDGDYINGVSFDRCLVSTEQLHENKFLFQNEA